MSVSKRFGTRLRLLFAFVPTLCLGMLLPLAAQAQTTAPPLPSKVPLELNLLRQNRRQARSDVITANTIPPTGLTIPSLWWAKEQFAGKMVSNWLAYPKERRVDLVVNPQLWTILDFIDRYSFVNEFGTVAKDYGYNIRVFDQQGTLLAAYTCGYSTTAPTCQIWFGDSSQSGLRIRSTPAVTPF